MEFKSSLLMPKTNFEMRGNLSQKEPTLVKAWQSNKLYEEMNKNREGCEEFLLHDGPPYANGDIHCGHMLNRLLKDFIIRYKNMEGNKTPFVFGWDTHGLPIEVMVSKSGVDRHKVSLVEFRTLCRAYAQKQVARQKEQIRRLGVLGDYDAPYLTLQKEYEARQLQVFSDMALKGLIYKGLKPVYWSPSSETALAEAEIEYKDVIAKTLYIAFPVKDGKGLIPTTASVLIWTTTPWTIPANLAVTLNPRFEYGLFHTNRGDFVFLSSLAESLSETLGFSECTLLKTFKGSDLEGVKLKHPLYSRDSLVLNADFVTGETGTGAVHTAPDHGLDDFNACLKYDIHPFCPVDERGIMRLEEGDPCNGLFYEDANDVVIDELTKKGLLLKEIDISHSYPHDWRTKKPVIFRATPQWFCSISPIREQLLSSLSSINWDPSWGAKKMENMIKDRADWCISRQRAWGVPLPIIYCEDDSPIIDKEVFDRIVSIVAEKGSDAWYSLSEKELLPEGYSNTHSPNGIFRKETDIMDVWFDSGSSWNGVLKERGLSYPADLYLEGNDQYRGWFNASLTLSMAVNGISPFKNCLTHGMVMDEKWQKMSKSSGNGVDPSKVADIYGADLLRLWAASVDYRSDVRMGEALMKQTVETYRKIRNTFRFMLGNLQDGEKAYSFTGLPKDLSLAEQFVLSRFETLKNKILQSYANYDFSSVVSSAANFLVGDMSSFYLDISKDILYCDSASSLRRKAIQAVLWTVSHDLCLLLNPILPFTMDEIYHSLPGCNKVSPQLEDMPKESHMYDASLLNLYTEFLKSRDVALKALEEKRSSGLIGNSSDADIELSVSNHSLFATLSELKNEEKDRLYLVHSVILIEGEDACLVNKAEGKLCPRCRNIVDTLIGEGEDACCPRCLKALKGE